MPKAHFAADYARWFASQGGKARVAAMTAKQRQDLASLAGVARWRKSTKAEPKAAAQDARFLDGLVYPLRLPYTLRRSGGCGMTTAETVRRLLLDAAGEALCDCCLAFACSVSLTEMREVTKELLNTLSFHRLDRCVSCRRHVSAVAFVAKCAHCSQAVLPGAKAFEADGDIMHAACFARLVSSDTIRISRKLTAASRRMIEESRRRIHQQRGRQAG